MTTLAHVEIFWAAVGLFTGGAVGAWLGLRRKKPETTSAPSVSTLPSGVIDLITALRYSAAIMASDDTVIAANPAAYAYGVVSGTDLTHPSILRLVREVRRDGRLLERELELRRGPLGEGRRIVRARVAVLENSHVLVLVEDRTAAARVKQVRRDFVENVSHELKTPIGGISLLTEAIQDATDDPEAIRRFAARLHVESNRLSGLVQDIISLSRLQVAGSSHPPRRLPVAPIITEAIDRCRVMAEARSIDVDAATDPQAMVYGDADLLMTAIRNVVDNAIAYSNNGTRVSVTTTCQNGLVEISVTDQGVGIPEDEQGRIFERFYRVDPARSRATGGTGLGLSMVKHICADHGGEVTLWSRPGAGSTFTIRLPLATSTGPATHHHTAPAETPTPLTITPPESTVTAAL
ncbi:MAG: sensor histidine kinase [Actinomycetota bacterium]